MCHVDSKLRMAGFPKSSRFEHRRPERVSVRDLVSAPRRAICSRQLVCHSNGNQYIVVVLIYPCTWSASGSSSYISPRVEAKDKRIPVVWYCPPRHTLLGQILEQSGSWRPQAVGLRRSGRRVGAAPRSPMMRGALAALWESTRPGIGKRSSSGSNRPLAEVGPTFDRSRAESGRVRHQPCLNLGRARSCFVQIRTTFGRLRAAPART